MYQLVIGQALGGLSVSVTIIGMEIELLMYSVSAPHIGTSVGSPIAIPSIIVLPQPCE